VTTSAITSDNVARSGDPRSVDFYSRDPGLWPIEERLIREFTRPPPASILDLGCGAGRTTHGLRRAGWKTCGLDLSEPLLRSAQRRFPDLPLLQADATALTFASQSFDAVLFSFNGLDYVYPEAAREQCVTEVYRVLRPGGVFVFSSHNLIGALFSGGYFYLRGYWNALKMLTAQVGTPHWREWYLRYQDLGGPQYFFSAPPGRTVRTLQRTGFVVDDVRGASGERRPRAVLMHQAHVYFVARKPAA
jgi:SAM-dependent methyltransferase